MDLLLTSLHHFQESQLHEETLNSNQLNILSGRSIWERKEKVKKARQRQTDKERSRE
jgi:hypothetical protein